MIPSDRPPGNGGPGAAPPDVQDLLQYALEFRAWGWSVFPLASDKRPAVAWKRFQDRRPTDRELGRLFDRTRVGGLAVVTGSASGGRDWVLGCRDFDTADAYRVWAGRRPRLAAVLPTVRTFRGLHVYGRLRGPDRFVRFTDGELRASRRHYVALPPSRHPAGPFYEWVPHRPDCLRDFPVLDAAESGFLDGPAGSTGSFVVHRPPYHQNRHPEPPDGLCDTATEPASSDAVDLTGPAGECVLRTVPRRPGERNGRLLALARSLRDIYPPETPVVIFTPAVRAWWRLALPVIRTADWATTWADFRHAWVRATVPMSVSVPKLVTSATAAGADDPRAKLMAACRALANLTGGAFHLSCRDAGRVAGVSYRTAARLLAEMSDDRTLDVVRHGLPSARTRLATVYRLPEPVQQQGEVAG